MVGISGNGASEGWFQSGGSASRTVSGTFTNSTGSHGHTINYAGTSGNATNANIPKYKAVYIWERTA